MSLRPDALLSHPSGPDFQWTVDRLIWLLKNEPLGC
ncbi:hypothetical protein HMPREF1487_05569 [Pseudomonas sp. HPB0071]|uniref:Uncharacterized protein n=1 Tax=Pseudomonas luteola TaxID=47886 RepID=A0A2X2CU63_PSELU|nr:hypothetical protein HMPREF1487_05569 [Pseudomonas sp. HPB0071]SHJ34407.1 hypothetical protein SAMN05216295_111179 [Pseudomonas zeshuii]SPZ11767.1 Uncharacterised protein [Pseudomonas luteola]